jgi:superfamily I DNA and/or RNA helicase
VLVHDEQASRKSNRFEVELIAALIQAGVENNALEEGSIAIMTPHRAQRALLEQELARWSDYITIIDTVERLQGGEQTNIIVSATVSDPIAMAQAGEFVLDLQRANVAFSRTKQRLFVVASQVLFDHIPSQVDVYATAKLWKHLRYLCQRCISTQHIGEHRVVHLAPEEQQF